MADRLDERLRLFERKGLHRADFELYHGGGWTRDEELASVMRFSTMAVVEVGTARPLRARLALFRDLTFMHASSSRARVLWDRDALSVDRVLSVYTRRGGVDIETDGVVVRRPGVTLVAPGTSSVMVSLTGEDNEVFYTVSSARAAGAVFPESSCAFETPLDPALLQPSMMFMAGLCRIATEGAGDASPLYHAAQQVARGLIGQVVGERRPAGLFVRAMEFVVADYADPRISVAVVARRLGVGIRTLQAAFSAEGTTFAAQLRDVRVRAALRLREGNPSLAFAVVSRAVGFGSESSLYRALRLTRGVRPDVPESAENTR